MGAFHGIYHVHTVYLLDIPKQPTCMKLRTGEFYQPVLSCARRASWRLDLARSDHRIW